MEVSKYLQQNNSERVRDEYDNEKPKEKYISPEKKQKIIDDLRSIQYCNNGISKNNRFFREYTKSTI